MVITAETAPNFKSGLLLGRPTKARLGLRLAKLADSGA